MYANADTGGKKKKQPNFTTATIWSSIEGQPRWNLTWCTDCWDYFVHLLKHRMIYNSLQKGQVVSGWGHPTAGDKQTGRGTNAPHTLRFLCSLAKWWSSYLISLCPNRHVLLEIPFIWYGHTYSILTHAHTHLEEMIVWVRWRAAISVLGRVYIPGWCW